MPQQLTRRDFLRTGSRLALGLGLSQALWSAGCSGGGAPAPGSSTVTDLPWDELARRLQGPLLRPGMAGFDQVAAPWALQYASLRPGGIARCVSAADVQAALQWARDFSVPLVARSGGHSYSGYSTTPGLMISVSLMNDVVYDPATGRAVLGGGARNANAYAALRTPNRAVTHGRCKQVGVAGLVLGGGIGFNMRAHGLTCDQLVETEVVLASGEVVVCNEQENSDLFWACRGAGGGHFGIHTSFTFQTFPVTTLTVYKITWTSSIPEVLQAFLDLLPQTTEAMGCKVSVEARLPGPTLTLVLLGQLVGTPAELQAILAPVFQVAAPSIPPDIRELSYWDGQEFLSEEGLPEYSHERSRYAFAPIPQAGTDTIIANLMAWPGTSVAGTWKFFLTGGAIDEVARDATAYVHRGATMISSIELEWAANDAPDQVAANEAWLDAFHEAMVPFTSGECYQNFIDHAQEDFLDAYYAENLARLIEVKRRYDPENLFHYPQSIPV